MNVLKKIFSSAIWVFDYEFNLLGYDVSFTEIAVFLGVAFVLLYIFFRIMK